EHPDAAADPKKTAPYLRFIAVVGLETATRTAARQAATLRTIAYDLGYQRDRQRDAFATTLLPVVEESRNAARAAEQLANDFKSEHNKVLEQQILVNQRKQDVMIATNELAAKRVEVAKRLVNLRD